MTLHQTAKKKKTLSMLALVLRLKAWVFLRGWSIASCWLPRSKHHFLVYINSVCPTCSDRETVIPLTCSRWRVGRQTAVLRFQGTEAPFWLCQAAVGVGGEGLVGGHGGDIVDGGGGREALAAIHGCTCAKGSNGRRGYNEQGGQADTLRPEIQLRLYIHSIL